MGSDRRFNRRFVDKPGQLKENKISIEKGKSLKKKGKGTDIIVESPEYQLLVKLFVPPNLLIYNNRVSQMDLSTYLPIIINDKLPSLNFELHIFLSSIVTTYVASWYALKLNTENFEFLELVYNSICELVKDFAKRVLQVISLPRLIDLLNKCASVLDSHIRLVHNPDGIPPFVKLELAKRVEVVTSQSGLALETIVSRYLENSHIIFQSAQNCQTNNSPRGFEYAGDDTKLEDLASPRLMYLRLVVRNIVTVAFDRHGTEVPNTPVTSNIGMNLISLVLADLVLDKVISKLASPQFILQVVIGKIGLSLQGELDRRKETPQDSPYERIKNTLRAINLGIKSSWKLFNACEKETVSDTPSVLFSPFLSLIDGVTGICSRRPVFTSTLGILRSIITSNSFLSDRIETAARKFVLYQTSKANFLQDEAQASIVRMLREIVFSVDKTQTISQDPANMDSLVEIWFSLLSKESTSTLPIGISLESFQYKDESRAELRKCIENFMRVFDQENSGLAMQFSEKSDLNKLLVIRLFDSVVQSLYPEMVESIGVTV